MANGKLHHRAHNLTGQKFGMLMAVWPEVSEEPQRRTTWMFHCECGRMKSKAASDVRKDMKAGRVPNCGGITKSQIGSKNSTHGMTSHPVYWVWRSMRDRCRLLTHQAWRNYGGRGIRVCPRWDASFEAFWADMGPTYAPGLEIDRENNDGNYEPGNCRWITSMAQCNNKRNNRFIQTPEGPMTVKQASRRFGVGNTTIFYRMAQGWPEDKLLEPPSFADRGFSTSSTAARATVS